MSNRPLQFSVVICTFNRVEWLRNALTSICEQTLDSSEYEIIVVDNNSSDGTRTLAEEYCSHHDNIRYCFEEEQGLSHARNRGYKEAAGEYVAYIDDDAKAPQEWLEVASRIINEQKPAAFGGPYFAFYLTPKPKWFKDEYGSQSPIHEARPLINNESLYGANLFIRADVLSEIGGFDIKLGMSGDAVGYGEETELIVRLRKTMPDQAIYYDPELLIYHLVTARKMTLRWYVRERFVGGRYLYSMNKEKTYQPSFVLIGQLIRSVGILLKQVFNALFHRNKQRYPFVQNHLYENALMELHSLGHRFEQLLGQNRYRGEQ